MDPTTFEKSRSKGDTGARFLELGLGGDEVGKEESNYHPLALKRNQEEQ